MVETLNIAQICPATRVLGPGKRFVIWVQGCPFSCAQCVAPDWIPRETNCLTSITELARRITAVQELEGLTLSGGEPMLQAEGLAALLRMVRQTSPQLSAIAFSGFTLAQLRRRADSEPGIGDLLSELDVLIDGLYRAELNDDLGMRGSSNQQVHYLTSRYENRKEEFERRPREIEIHLLRNEMLMVGVPSVKSFKTFKSLASEVADPASLRAEVSP
jgi:anaerobic ribonucleoside-triphosphate reductase activating protein